MERRLWTPQEDHIIILLVKQHGRKKWTLIADEMQKISPKNSRTSKQIRQRWHNHLDPQVNKQPWTSEEEKMLFDAHRKYGSKWKDIASLLQRRTDNYVKNHFYSTLRRSLRRINKYLGSKNSTNQMRTIKPSILSYLLDLSDADPQIRILVSKIFQFANFKPSKNSQIQYLPNFDKNQFQSAITKLIQINESYTQEKNKKKGRQNFKIKTPYFSKQQYSQKIQHSTYKNIQEISQRSQEQRICQEIGSWHHESPINTQYQMLPQIQVPQYECQLLSEKVQNDYDLMEESKRMETVNMFVS